MSPAGESSSKSLRNITFIFGNGLVVIVSFQF